MSVAGFMTIQYVLVGLTFGTPCRPKCARWTLLCRPKPVYAIIYKAATYPINRSYCSWHSVHVWGCVSYSADIMYDERRLGYY